MMRDAVLVALLSQLSQQCGAALVRVRDEVSRSITFSRVVARRAVFRCRKRRRPRTVLMGQASRLCARQCGVGTPKKQYRS